MYNLFMILENIKNKTILLLGKTRAFEAEEFSSQLEVHNIKRAEGTQEDFDVVVEGRMMSPYEQNLLEDLYEKKKYEFLSVDTLEELLAKQIQEDVLLMSLKLSNDTERLKSFLQNEHISDTLFFKLLKMYRWDKEDFFENDANRDVSAALIGRFYENIERNHNVQYATTGITHLVRQTRREDLLEAIASLEPLALHPDILQDIALHPNTPKSVLKKFLKQRDEKAMEAMTYNENLDITLAKELLKEEKYAKILAQNISLSQEMFTLLKNSYALDLAHNPSLDLEMQKELLSLNIRDISLALASNSASDKEILELLLKQNDKEIAMLVYANENLPHVLLVEAFTMPQYHLSLAKNPKTPQEILQKLYEGKDSEVITALAQNEATPIDILYQLQLDSRYERFVKTNAAFGKHIQSENIGWLV